MYVHSVSTSWKQNCKRVFMMYIGFMTNLQPIIFKILNQQTANPPIKPKSWRWWRSTISPLSSYNITIYRGYYRINRPNALKTQLFQVPAVIWPHSIFSAASARWDIPSNKDKTGWFFRIILPVNVNIIIWHVEQSVPPWHLY